MDPYILAVKFGHGWVTPIVYVRLNIPFPDRVPVTVLVLLSLFNKCLMLLCAGPIYK